jgi:hypothetical protein
VSRHFFCFPDFLRAFQIADSLEGFGTEDSQEDEGSDQTHSTEKSSFSSLPSVYGFRTTILRRGYGLAGPPSRSFATLKRLKR